MNYTLHMNIKNFKNKLLGVNIIYLISPTEENVEFISEHCRLGLIDNIYINFINPASDQLLK